MLPAITCTSKDPSSASTVPIYCKDPRLSFEGPGQNYMALKLHSGVKPLSTEDLQLYLGFAASFLDMDSVRVEGKAHRSALATLMRARL